jgi:hypothetical protein
MINKDKYLKILKVSLIYTLSLCGIASVTYWLWQHPIYNPAGPQIQEAKSQIEVRFRDAIVKGRKNGTPYWTVFSKNVEVERDTPWVFFKDKPHGEFYNLKDWSKSEQNPENTNNIQPNLNPSPSPDSKNERLRTFIWNADKAEYNTDTEDLNLKQNVNIITDDKDSIKTEEMHWNNSKQKATSDKRTVIVAHKGHPVIHADSVEGDVKLDILNLKGHVEITTELTDEQQL